ncbi:serine hydrolase domain-containing protein [Actinosynnema sp. NPDC023587]|uniref:serine hydrolase domain-containing protein n=1 Tax=Actinosynnema sp. NPDC023587 TaxID=3154695 RepID=UPI0033CBB006
MLVANGAPGVLVELVTPRGGVKVRSGRGDLRTQAPVPWNAKFRIGSFTKTFLAATLLQLVGEGRLSLEDSVDRWLPGLVSGNGNDGRAITVRQLLQHTSGLPEYVAGMPDLFDEKGFRHARFTTLEPEDAVRLALRSAPDFPPGTGWNYSNTNFMLAGMILEKVTGRTWQHEVTARIVRPLGLHHTSTPGTSPFIPHPHARGYDRFPEEGPGGEVGYRPVVDVTVMNPSWGGPAGAMISTTEDGNEFLRALMDGRVLRPAQLAEMKRTVPTTEGRAEYGLGLIKTPTACGSAYSHGGTIHGFRTRNGVTEDGRRSVVVSVNTRTPIAPDGTVQPDGPVEALIEHALCGTS